MCSFVGQSNTHMYIFSQEFTASEGHKDSSVLSHKFGVVEWSGVEWSGVESQYSVWCSQSLMISWVPLGLSCSLHTHKGNGDSSSHKGTGQRARQQCPCVYIP